LVGAVLICIIFLGILLAYDNNGLRLYSRVVPFQVTIQEIAREPQRWRGVRVEIEEGYILNKRDYGNFFVLYAQASLDAEHIGLWIENGVLPNTVPLLVSVDGVIYLDAESGLPTVWASHLCWISVLEERCY
jgi:hypothetical protein